MKIKFSIARKKTCWWSNDWKPTRKINLREDKLFAFTRIYCRTYKLYAYRLILGRLSITFI